MTSEAAAPYVSTSVPASRWWASSARSCGGRQRAGGFGVAVLQLLLQPGDPAAELRDLEDQGRADVVIGGPMASGHDDLPVVDSTWLPPAV